MDDLIYRQELLRIIDQRILNKRDARKQKHSALFVEGMEDGYFRIRSDVCQMPSADRKKGYWIDEPVYKQTMDGKTWDGYTYCSECKEMHEYGYRSNFCPNCGAEMREREKE